jgi:recombination protein RecA
MAKKFDLQAYKDTLKTTELQEKKPKYVVLNEDLQSALGLPGFPLGDITQIYGDSDTGKSTLMLEAAAKCQQQDILPVLIIVEKKYREDRARMMGLDTENAIINLNCRSVEDIFEFCDKILADVNKGRLPHDVMIFIDSLGNVNSREARKENKDGTVELKNIHQKNAKVISEHMRLMSDRVCDTRYETHNHYIGMVILNQMYESMTPSGIMKHQFRGGKQLKYTSSLQIKTSKVKELSAIVEGKTKTFGIVSKIKVEKNHISNIKNTGEFVITADSIFANESGAIEDYKKRNRAMWGDSYLLEEGVAEND